MAEKVFEVEISNKTPSAYETAATLEMPATWAEFHDALEKARIEDGRDCCNELTNIWYEGITWIMIGDDVNLYELNLLAQRLSTLNEDDRMSLNSLLQMEQARKKGPIPLPRFINLTYNADICLLAPQVSNHRELGALLYGNGMLPQEAMALLDTTEEGSEYQKELLEVFGKQYQEEHGGVFTRRGYVEPGNDFKEVYNRGEIMPYFHRSGAPVVLEVRKGFFDDPAYDNDRTATLDLPAVDGAVWNAVEAVDAASLEECAFRCIDCRIPFLRDAIDDAIDDEGGIEQANAFARLLAQKQRVWDARDFTRYKALLAASGRPDLEQAAELAEALDEYELRPEVAESWEYAELVLREKYPDLPEELFQTPQAARIGQRWLEQGDAAITDYGLLRRKDGGLLPRFQPEQERQIQQRQGGMGMR